MKQPRQLKIISGLMNIDGTVTHCSDPGVGGYKISAGIYVILLPPDFRWFSAHLTPKVTAAAYATLVNMPGTTAVQIDVWNSAAASTDYPCSFTFFGETR